MSGVQSKETEGKAEGPNKVTATEPESEKRDSKENTNGAEKDGKEKEYYTKDEVTIIKLTNELKLNKI